MDWHIVVSFIMILLLDIALSTDNAGVNAVIVKSFPKEMRSKVLLLGVLVAIALRIFLTVISGYLYHLPGLKLLGGIWVFLMGLKMLASQDEDEGKTISGTKGYILAGILLGWTDLTMSVDNVLALIGAANGNMVLVTIGVILTIPLLFLATKVIVSLMEKYANLNYFFAGLLGYIGFKMIFEDGKTIITFFTWLNTYPVAATAISGFLVIIMVAAVKSLRSRKSSVETRDQANLADSEAAATVEKHQ